MRDKDGQVKFYVNGQKEGETTDGRALGNALPLTIGAGSGEPAAAPLDNAAIDELRIFGRALTGAEIRALAGDLQLSFGGLVPATGG